MLKTRKKSSYVLVVILVLNVANIFAQAPNIGSVSTTMIGAMDAITDLVLAAVSIAGIACFFSALMKLHLHRKNPQQVPISQFFSMLVMSLALIGLPLMILYGDTAYKLLKDL